MKKYATLSIFILFVQLAYAADTLGLNYRYKQPARQDMIRKNGINDGFKINNLVLENFTPDLLMNVLSSFNTFSRFRVGEDMFSLDISGNIELEDITSGRISLVKESNYCEYCGMNAWNVRLKGYLDARRITFRDDLHIRNIEMAGRDAYIYLSDIKASMLSVLQVKTPLITLTDVSGFINIVNSSIGRLVINDYKPDRQVKRNQTGPDLIVENSSIKDCSISKSDVKFLWFRKDSLLNELTFDNDDKAFEADLMVFHDTYFNATVRAKKPVHVKKLIFYDVEFDKDADFSKISCDTLEFIECGLLPYTLSLNSIAGNDGMQLMIVNTDISKARFTYRDDIQLLFTDTSRQSGYFAHFGRLEEILNVYNDLLTKFKTEGKDVSYKELDIQRRRLKLEHATYLQTAGHYINRAWWYYGYRKDWIFIWTLYFLMFFYVLNYYLWNKVQATYPIIEHDRRKHGIFYAVMFYTLFVFLSLRIDMSKLNFKYRGMVILFFAQYLAGLTCLFFILNAIIRLN